ncbi:alpha/beta hydrolase [Zooshikella harenae]|uniref:Alpha/beta fold hydrolase n=1 Tax=Zooshikella harenae TaxID=2827238 RepID=A0ABS5ZI69_9GAMM|nr:alpha/beta fold hydrolase [Zooshikella harenae]MBU2713767.1 alpha/beta fold hydrolase [Zooshikella harenae]
MSTTTKEIEFILIDQVRLAAHKWIPTEIKGVVFYFHGLQSHGGWLWEVGNLFASNNLAFICIDRRGCGMSEGERQIIPPVNQLLLDYTLAISHCLNKLPKSVPINLFGHCLGGSILAALLNYKGFTIKFDSVVFCSAWLGKLYSTLNEKELEKIRFDKSDELWDAGLHAEDFTSDSRYSVFIDDDTLATRKLVSRSRKHLLDLEEYYLGSNWNCKKPVVFISGTDDTVVDLSSALSVFQDLTAGKGTIVHLPTSKHYLFFTEVKNSLVNWVSYLTVSKGNIHCV